MLARMKGFKISMIKQYRVRSVTAILVCLALYLSGCSGVALPGQTPTETPRPFDRFTAQEVVDALIAAGLPLQNVQSDISVGRGAPLTFNERLIFEIPRIAPNGGQVVTFTNAEDMQAWQDWIVGLRSNPDTRRDVIYVYTNQNAIIQLNAGLTNQEANVYRDTFLGLE